ncbi:MAG: aldehyde dehydrogenase, partial [Cytophagaceae bacterium]
VRIDQIHHNLSILFCEKDELVSVDYNGNLASSTIDLASTMTVGPRMVKVLSWYDNESGFSSRMVDVIADFLINDLPSLRGESAYANGSREHHLRTAPSSAIASPCT